MVSPNFLRMFAAKVHHFYSAHKILFVGFVLRMRMGASFVD